MPTNLCWICICPMSAAKRLNTGDFTAIHPKSKCPDCGHTYDQVNVVAWEGSYQ